MNLKDDIQLLINRIIDKYNIKKVYAVGSSKGGWAAIYYGTLLSLDVIIAGAPQYYIGDYLNCDDKHKLLLYGIVGKANVQENIQMLNCVLKNTLNENNNKKSKYIIHFSKKEHTYNEHIKYLLEDLYKNRYNVVEDQDSYLNHSEVGIAMQKLLSNYFEKELNI